jgi:putative Holliday junction resolvase
MRYLGIDFGSKRVGLALSDESGAMGFPHAVIPNDGRLIDYVMEIIARKDVEVVVIGDSLDNSGNPNPIREKSKSFAVELERKANVEVVWEPEHFTSQEARRDPVGVRTNTREAVDASAAALILSSYLSRNAKPKEKRQGGDEDSEEEIDPYDTVFDS